MQNIFFAMFCSWKFEKYENLYRSCTLTIDMSYVFLQFFWKIPWFRNVFFVYLYPEFVLNDTILQQSVSKQKPYSENTNCKLQYLWSLWLINQGTANLLVFRWSSSVLIELKTSRCYLRICNLLRDSVMRNPAVPSCILYWISD